MRVLVIGGGLGGLSAAYYLLKAGVKVTIVEKTARLGGWIKTIQDPKTGLFLEKGPRTIRPSGIVGLNTLSLIEQLELQKEVVPILRSHPTAQNRFIYVNNELHALPNNLASLFKRKEPLNKNIFDALKQDLTTPPEKLLDDSIYRFAKRRFGKEVAEYLISPMICGICAGNAKEISVKFLMSEMFEAEQKFGGVSLGYLRKIGKNIFSPKKDPLKGLGHRATSENWSVWHMRGGMSDLIHNLGDHVSKNGADLLMSAEVSDLKFHDNSVKCSILDKCYSFDHVLSSLPAPQSASLVKQDHPELAKGLFHIPFVNVAVVNFIFHGKVLKQDAFGFLVPPSQNLPILGVIFDSCTIPQGDWTVLTAMLGGHWFQQYFGDNPSKEYIIDTALSNIKTILDINEHPVSCDCEVLNQCIPQYVVGHYTNLKDINFYLKAKQLPLSLIGSSYNGIGINDVIMQSKIAAENVLSGEKYVHGA